MIYTDDIEEAHLTTSRFVALMDIDFLPEPDKFDIAVVPVVDNPLFGLMIKKKKIKRRPVKVTCPFLTERGLVTIIKD
ncbi:hypothetical protein [Photorhabdus thracensis]|uniref:hypothetical protein n=1 Tax=Photorhabdus thracensis TaxID=230089 RepID=UPI001E6275ED|nr:hypothetical protein [Photorhabdus thracensis]MCC8422486.1 hypothetical protein [Photorhabdus thracensis]